MWLSYESFLEQCGILTNKEFKKLPKKYQNLLKSHDESSSDEDDDIVSFSASGSCLEILNQIIKDFPDLHIATQTHDEMEANGSIYFVCILENKVRFSNRDKYFLCKGNTNEDLCNEEWLEDSDEGLTGETFEVFYRNNNYFDESGNLIKLEPNQEEV